MGKLTEAGFDDEAAVRSLALLTSLCWAYARDAIHVSRSGERLRSRLTRELVEGRGPEASEYLARIVERGVDTYDVHQLELSIEVFIHGIEAVLLGPSRSGAPSFCRTKRSVRAEPEDQWGERELGDVSAASLSKRVATVRNA
ncbi:hypothetical protein ACWEQC_45650 [Streptomyces shenzhenensis]